MRPTCSHDGRDAGRDAIIRYIDENHSIRTYPDVIAYGYWPQNLGPAAYIDIVANYRGARFIDAAKTNYHSVANTAVVAELRITTYDNAPKVINHEVSPNLNLAWQFHARNYLDAFESDFVEQGKELPQYRRSNSVAPSTEPVHHKHPEALCAPITAMGSQIMSNVLKHALVPARQIAIDLGHGRHFDASTGLA
jgi:hypothetical protein